MKNNNVSAFTLTELLVVIGIIALLSGLLMTAVHSSRKTADRAACLSNLRQVGMALNMYIDANGKFPKACNMPSLGLSPLPGIAEVLMSEVGDNTNVFACPSDDKYFKSEGSSYEWNSFLNGKTRNSLIHGRHIEDDKTRVLWDYEAFHGEEGEEGARNLLFLSTLVKKL